MQKDLSQATEALAEGLNELHGNQKKAFLDLIKRQASELERRAKIISRLETSVMLQQKNIEKLLEQNKHLESLIVSLKEERTKLLQENEHLKVKRTAKTRTRRVKKDTQAEAKSDVEQIA